LGAGVPETAWPFGAVGYKQAVAAVRGDMDAVEAAAAAAQATRRYAKRQMTWFRSKEQITWVDVDTLGSPESMAEEIVRQLHPTAASDSP